MVLPKYEILIPILIDFNWFMLKGLVSEKRFLNFTPLNRSHQSICFILHPPFLNSWIRPCLTYQNIIKDVYLKTFVVVLFIWVICFSDGDAVVEVTLRWSSCGDSLSSHQATHPSAPAWCHQVNLNDLHKDRTQVLGEQLTEYEGVICACNGTLCQNPIGKQ